jgi:hypothetical protein
VTIDLITKSADGSYNLIMVVEGPWSLNAIENRLKRLQERLYDYIEIAIEGHLEKLYPDSKGKKVTIRVDCYNPPSNRIKVFIDKFIKEVKQSDELGNKIKELGYVSSVEFEYSENN